MQINLVSTCIRIFIKLEKSSLKNLALIISLVPNTEVLEKSLSQVLRVMVMTNMLRMHW